MSSYISLIIWTISPLVIITYFWIKSMFGYTSIWIFFKHFCAWYCLLRIYRLKLNLKIVHCPHNTTHILFISTRILRLMTGLCIPMLIISPQVDCNYLILGTWMNVTIIIQEVFAQQRSNMCTYLLLRSILKQVSSDSLLLQYRYIDLT